MKSRFLPMGALAIVLVTASGCMAGDPPDLAMCEHATKAALKAPATYRRVESTRQEKPEFTRIYLEFDSANTYGTPLRGLAVCEFSAGTTAETRLPVMVAHQIDGHRISGPAINFSSSR